MDIKDIQNLIKFVSKAEVSEVKYKTKDFEITIKTPLGGNEMTYMQQPAVYHSAPQQQQQGFASPAQGSVPVADTPVATDVSDDSRFVTIKSPMIGTFYRQSGPDKPIFVNVGDEVKTGKVVCIIEAMKLFNEIESEISGTIVKVLVEDASPVEYDQPLFLVEPA